MSRILIVDDEYGLRDLLDRVLVSAGYEVTSVSTASAGLNKALTEHFDLILLDLMLPDLTGEQVMQVILDSQPDARILVLSSAPDPRRRVGVLTAGAVDYLSKPFVNAELVARVRLRLRDTGAPPTGDHSRIPLGPQGYLDLTRHELVLDDVHTALSHREFDLDPIPGRATRLGVHAQAGARRRVGTPVRPRHQRGGRLHRQAAREARASSHRNGAQCGLSTRELGRPSPQPGWPSLRSTHS